MTYLLLGFALLVAILAARAWASQANTGQLAQRMRAAIGFILLAGSAVFFVRGAVGPASALAMIGFWLLSSTGISSGGWGKTHKSPGQISSVRTDYLDISLDHDSGEISGEVLKGQFRGRDLQSLTPSQLAELWQECRFNDPQSAQVVEAFLDQVFPDWRQMAGGSEDAGEDSGGGGAWHDEMTRDEAFDILGLRPGASEEEIRAAHRALMKKLHPDRGGSTYFATKINQAKDVLLGPG